MADNLLGTYTLLPAEAIDPCVPKGLEEAYEQFQTWCYEYAGTFAELGIADMATVVEEWTVAHVRFLNSLGD